MRISDWSSDVCSSDLDIARKIGQTAFGQRRVAQVVHDHLPRNAVGAVRVTRRGQIPEFEPIAEPHTFLAHIFCGEHNIAAPAGKVPAEQRAHRLIRSEEHTSELQSLMRISYAVFCLKKKTKKKHYNKTMSHR